ncbi:MAG: tetratricopeptide repeat protein, partial [Clostridia bacterium]|nr:tetratricopeptide repeat protein [Clostridia bacterium]
MKRDGEYLAVKTKGGGSPQGKPRVYFCCHPGDFETYFDKVCEDILSLTDAAVYYTPDMTAKLPEQYKETDLGRMNLFVVPVTFRLLNEDNRAMREDIAFAKKEHIAILPLMGESGLKVLYEQERNFGKRQYLNPFDRDESAVGYREKLKKFLESVLIGGETAEKIRNAFDAYIFLSYRKKDRHHANRLMNRIHSDDRFRNIAIWYDEFLTPGENFETNIQKALDKSKLVTLLVTPNLVNETNYVQQKEYPAARKSGKPVLPAQMEPTDRGVLEKQYEEIAPCVDVDDSSFQERFAKELQKASVTACRESPERTYYIGLAYLDGVDVEVNAEKGLGLLRASASAGCPAAMGKLRDMYSDGDRVPLDYRTAAAYAEQLAKYCEKQYGEESKETLSAFSRLAVIYSDLGEYGKAEELDEKVYALRKKVLGEEHPDTLKALNNLAITYGDLGEYGKAKELKEKVYALRKKVLGEE